MFARSDMKLYLDIETIPSESSESREEIAKGITAPGNYKKPESIKEWEETIKPGLIDEALAKTSFDGTYGRIVCIGYAIDDSPGDTFCGQEKELLSAFFDCLPLNSLQVVGHNIAGFDLRFLWQRAVINGVRPPASLLRVMKAKPWDESIIDTMLLWHPTQRISLDKLCKALGVHSPKSEFDGSKVYAAYKAGEIQKIADYCKQDVIAVRECEKRLTFC